jgi:hypothetical protein|tara:strand:+ start:217 stop:381 length:165 start_codon:yes stop_codon:yes gene_type:complete
MANANDNQSNINNHYDVHHQPTASYEQEVLAQILQRSDLVPQYHLVTAVPVGSF